MKVLVFGGSGLLGSALVEVLPDLGHELRAPARAAYDIRSGPPPKSLFAGVDAAINAAAVKPGEDSDTAAWRVNAAFPHEVARACAEAGVPCVHISTDGVFSGSAGPYQEAAVPDPDDAYGIQKRAGEPAGCLVLRTSVIGPEQRGRRALLCWFLAQRTRVPGYVNHLWNGMTSLTLARAIAHLLAAGLVPPGVRHLHGEDTNKHDLLQALARAYGRDIVIDKAAAPVARDRRLRTRHPEFLAACAIPPLAEQLAELAALSDARGCWRARLTGTRSAGPA